MINWDKLTREDSEIIHNCVSRAAKMFEVKDRLSLIMDIEAAHIINPLKLRELYDADNFNFAHDICGIQRHINRNTGEMGDCFLPRFTA